MSQEKIWDREYRTRKLVTLGEKPQSDTLEFLRFLRKEQGIELEGKSVLDLGCGTGRNSNHCASEGAKVVGYEISGTALDLAKKRAAKLGISASVTYEKRSMGEPFPLADASVDIALDVTSSNSLSEAERAVYLSEIARVLKSGGWMYVKALCKDGDSNAKNLIRLSPGPEKDTYVMPDLGIVERVWTKEDFTAAYAPHFDIVLLDKKTNYSQVNGRSYKRNFWLAYLKKI